LRLSLSALPERDSLSQWTVREIKPLEKKKNQGQLKEMIPARKNKKNQRGAKEVTPRKSKKSY
jgi:hypothetical protein